MKIIYVTRQIQAGGPKTFALGLSQACKNLNIKLKLIVLTDNNHNNFYANLAPKVALIPFRTLLQRIVAVSRVKQNLSAADPKSVSIILTDTPMSSLVLLFALKSIKNLHFFYQFHGSSYLEKKSRQLTNKKIFQKFSILSTRLIEYFTYKQAKRIFVFSQYSKKLLTNHFYVKPSKIISTKPGIDQEFSKTIKSYTKSQSRKLMGIHPSTPVLLISSRIEERKGLLEFFDQFEEYGTILPKNLITFIASDLCHNLHLWKIVFNHQEVSSKSNFYFYHNPSRKQLALLNKAADVSAILSRDLETFGLSTLEAKSAGIQVIGFDIGANNELLSEQELVLPFDYQLFFQRLTQRLKTRRNIHKFNIKPYSYNNYIKHLFKQA